MNFIPYVKIPIGEEGLKATMMLKKEGIGVTMTAIFTSAQALISHPMTDAAVVGIEKDWLVAYGNKTIRDF